MKTLFISLVFICTSLAPLTAQEIQVEKTFGGYKYTQNGQSLTIGDMVRIMEPNEEALPVMKQARSNNTFAGILGFAGGFCIGYPIGQAIVFYDSTKKFDLKFRLHISWYPHKESLFSQQQTFFLTIYSGLH